MKTNKNESKTQPSPAKVEKSVQKKSTEYKEQTPLKHPHGGNGKNEEQTPQEHPHTTTTSVDSEKAKTGKK